MVAIFPGNSHEEQAPAKKRRRTFKEFLKKYFLYGQKTFQESARINQQRNAPDFMFDFMAKYRKPLGLLIPFCFVQIFYWMLAGHYGFYRLFPSRYEMSLVMAFGSFIGGATAEGGGAIAFPVMTLGLHIPPTIARDFAVMIQSVSMTSASFTIFFMGIVIEWHAIVFSSLGGAFGAILTIEFLDDLLSPNVKKMIFVSVFFSFAIALFLLNREHKRTTVDSVYNFTATKAFILFINGFVGGIFTGICGSGLDVYSFSILCLLFRVTEKVSTPTTISLMGINSLLCFFWRHHMQNAIDPLAWEYFAVCVPVVVVVAPLGSLCSSYCHRMTLACIIYILETAALITAYVVMRPGIDLILLSVGIILFSFVFYSILVRLGRRNIPEEPLAPLTDNNATNSQEHVIQISVGEDGEQPARNNTP